MELLASDTFIKYEDLPDELKDYCMLWKHFSLSGMYIISEYGDIWSYHTNKLLKMRLNSSGYYIVRIFNKNYTVHRLVYFAFEEDLTDNVIDHINRIKTDNHISNLRQVTYSENNRNCVRKTNVCIRIDKDFNMVEFTSIKDAVNNTKNATFTGIYDVLNGWQHTHADYRWERFNSKKVSYKYDGDGFKNVGIIEGFDLSNYDINSSGVIRKIIGNKRIVLKHQIIGSYMSVNININNTKEHKMFRVHRLVAYVFLGETKTLYKTVVNHKNKNKTDNRVDNLEWCTCRENIRHAIGKEIKSIDINTGEEKIYKSITDASIDVNANKSDTIGRVCRGERKTAYGKRWYFINP